MSWNSSPHGASSKQAARATELASTVYSGVKQKMGAMKAELTSLRESSSALREQMLAKEEECAHAIEAANLESDAKLLEIKEASELTISRHLSFIDRLLADKQELSKQCEALTAQMRSLEERYTAGEPHL